VGRNFVEEGPFVNGFIGRNENKFRRARVSAAHATLLNWQKGARRV